MAKERQEFRDAQDQVDCDRAANPSPPCCFGWASLVPGFIRFHAAIVGANAQPPSPLLYYSDYFSFVGNDRRGSVFLAHDNNRGRDGDEFQADRWIVMYDEREGWIEVRGSQHYKNARRQLERIPDSAHFSFAGTTSAGIKIESPINEMSLSIDPIPQTLRRETADRVFGLERPLTGRSQRRLWASANS